MKKAYSLYLRTTDNVGDLHASPADHFSFPIEVEKVCVHDCFDLDLSESFVMLGGGGLIHCGAPGQRMEYLEKLCKLSPYMVTWGMGHNIHGSDILGYPDYFVEAFMLHGVRDYKQNLLPWVPCASCMHPIFDQISPQFAKYDVRRTYSVTGHDLDSYPSLDKLEKREHTKVGFEDCIEFLATGEYVVTNSYHGAYWGALLGKKVVVFDPISSKFFYMFNNIVVASPDTWVNSLSLAEPDDSLLELCRIKSRLYHNRVCDMMEVYLRV